MRVLCAGDQFIRAESLAAAATAALGPDVEPILYETQWPDVSWNSFPGIREAAGDPARIAELAGDAAVLLTHLAPVNAQVFDNAPALRVVGVTRGGPVNVDLAAATAHGVPVVYLPGRNLGAVAEFVIGVMISLTRSVVRSSRELSGGRWDPKYFRFGLTGPELRACTVGLVGLGAVGARVAQLLGGFGSRVVAYDPYADPETAASVGTRLVPLAELLATSDIVSVHARLTPDTRRMFDEPAFAGMKPGAYFVNTARGELVEQKALLAALESGHLSGAALDVFDPEPPQAHDPLLSRPDVIVTPHLAGSSRQVATESAQRVAAEVAQFVRDGTLPHCANPDWVHHRDARR